jgi:hypothetical protein
VNPNATWSVLLESYYSYLQPQKVLRASTTSCTYGSLPKSAKSAKSRFGCLRLLGVKRILKNYHFYCKLPKLNFYINFWD